MLINVAQLLKEPTGSSRNISVDEIIRNKKKHDKEFHILGEAKLIRTDKGILITGAFTGEVTATCNRCLQPVVCSTNFDIEEEFLPTIDIHTGLPLVIVGDEFTIDDHHNINLSDALYQYASLSIPMKILCRDDCAGICQSCGQNLNKGKCNCETPSHDPRWSKLIALRKEKK